jgi:hypothetical protein
MAMKLLAFHDQLVADFTADDQNDNFVAFDIVQQSQVPSPQLKFGEGIGTQSFDCF